MHAHRAFYDAIANRDVDLAGRTVEALLAQAAEDLAETRKHAEKAAERSRGRRRTG